MVAEEGRKRKLEDKCSWIVMSIDSVKLFKWCIKSRPTVVTVCTVHADTVQYGCRKLTKLTI